MKQKEENCSTSEMNLPLFLEPIQKSNSVILVEGIIKENPGVRAKDCGQYRSEPELLTINYGDPTQTLMGCNKKNVKNTLI